MFDFQNHILKAIPSQTEHASRTVVRVSTSYWSDNRGLHLRKDITYLKRLCVEHNLLEEDCSSIGAEDAYKQIANINDVTDGIYEVVAVNIKRDWECGYIDGYDLKLVPFNTGENND